MARHRKITDHKNRHDRYIRSLARALTDAPHDQVVCENVRYDRVKHEFERNDANNTSGLEDGAFFEYDLVSFDRAAGGPNLRSPRWFAEFTAEKSWDREKLIYEAWRWMWFSRELAERLDVPAIRKVWYPSARASTEVFGDVAEVTELRLSHREFPIVYYVLKNVPLNTIWLKGVPAQSHKEALEGARAIPADLRIEVWTPNAFERDRLGRPSLFSRAYSGTNKSRLG